MVGTVYLQPEPGANKFVKIGDCESGQTLLIIEAMKTMNPIDSIYRGKLLKFLSKTNKRLNLVSH